MWPFWHFCHQPEGWVLQSAQVLKWGGKGIQIRRGVPTGSKPPTANAEGRLTPRSSKYSSFAASFSRRWEVRLSAGVGSLGGVTLPRSGAKWGGGVSLTRLGSIILTTLWEYYMGIHQS